MQDRVRTPARRTWLSGSMPRNYAGRPRSWPISAPRRHRFADGGGLAADLGRSPSRSAGGTGPGDEHDVVVASGNHVEQRRRRAGLESGTGIGGGGTRTTFIEGGKPGFRPLLAAQVAIANGQ